MIINNLKHWELQDGFKDLFVRPHRLGGWYLIRGKKLGPETREVGIKLGRFTVKTWYHPRYGLKRFTFSVWGWEGFKTIQIVLFHKEFRLTVAIK